MAPEIPGISTTSLPTIPPSATDTDKAIEDKTEELKTAEKSEEKAEISTTSGKSVEELKKEVESLEREKSLNYKKMAKIEFEIKELTQSVKDGMAEAEKLQELAIEEHKEEADKAVEENIAAYVEANKEGGDGMSKAELQANISKSMPDSPNLAKALGAYVTASRELAEIDTLLDNLNGIILDTNCIEIDLKDKTEAIKASEAAPPKKCCDPIGFMKDGARYDFIVDDGSFDSTSDFLGAENQWAAMEALDSDGDHIINASELKDSGIKMVKTVNGEQQIVDIADEFGEDFEVDLNSYQSGGSYDGIDTSADTDADGVVNQQLLGTYTIHVGDSDIKGYNTLDDVDYLASEYGVDIGSAKSETTDLGVMSDELKVHDNFFNEFSDEAQKLEDRLKNGLASYGLAEDTLDTIKEHAKTEADKDANIFMAKMEAEAEEEQKIEDAKKAEEVEEAEEAAAAEEAEEAEEAEKPEEAEEAKDAADLSEEEIEKLKEENAEHIDP